MAAKKRVAEKKTAEKRSILKDRAASRSHAREALMREFDAIRDRVGRILR